jgi:hypothetical protein
MAQKVFVSHTCDVDPTAEAEYAGMRFGLDGISYEIDLSAQYHDELREVLERYAAHARRADGHSSGGRRPARTASTNGHIATGTIATKPKGARVKPDPEETRRIREWARREGYEISDRGRIPHAIEDAYHEAHP